MLKIRPKDTITDELTARRWGPSRFAKESGLPLSVICDLLNDRLVIDGPISEALGRAFGVSPEFFIRLEEICQEKKL
jgi:plasmid maintenance system antidote protein VapI